MRFLQTTVIATALCAAAPVIGWCADAAVSPPAWKPDPALTARLTSPITLGRSSIQMPAGWTLQRNASQAHVVDVYRFTPTGTPALRSARLQSQPPREFVVGTQIHGENWQPEAALRAAVSRRTAKATGVKESPVEHGTIQGFAAVRIYVKMQPPASSHSSGARLFAYVIDEGSAAATIVGYDATPSAKENLTLLDAAALTFVLAPAQAVPTMPAPPPGEAPPPSNATPPPPDATPQPVPPPDATPPPDTTPPPDAQPAPDPTPPPDMTPQPDPGPPPDMTPQPDPGPPPDMSGGDQPTTVPIGTPIGPMAPVQPGVPMGPYDPQGPADPSTYPPADQQPTDPSTDPRQMGDAPLPSS